MHLPHSIFMHMRCGCGCCCCCANLFQSPLNKAGRATGSSSVRNRNDMESVGAHATAVGVATGCQSVNLSCGQYVIWSHRAHCSHHSHWFVWHLVSESINQSSNQTMRCAAAEQIRMQMELAEAEMWNLKCEKRKAKSEEQRSLRPARTLSTLCI